MFTLNASRRQWRRGRRETSDSLLAGMALDQFDSNLVRPFDEREFYLAARDRTNLVSHLDAVFAQFLQGFGQIRDAEPDVVDDPALGRFKLGLSSPMFGISLLCVLDWVDDDVDVVHRQ